MDVSIQILTKNTKKCILGSWGLTFESIFRVNFFFFESKVFLQIKLVGQSSNFYNQSLETRKSAQRKKFLAMVGLLLQLIKRNTSSIKMLEVSQDQKISFS